MAVSGPKEVRAMGSRRSGTGLFWGDAPGGRGTLTAPVAQWKRVQS